MTRMVLQRGHRLVAVVACAFFFVPMSLWVLGVGSNDDRRGTDVPHSFTSWDWIDETRAYVDDQLPFRSDAVRWRAQATRAVFDEAPPGRGVALDEGDPRGATATPNTPGASDVVLGKDDWLFLTNELEVACNEEKPIRSTISKLRQFAKAIEASGREVVVTIAPDKAGIEHEHLPDDSPYRDCAAKGSAEFFQALRSAGIPGYLDIRSKILAIEQRQDRELYLRKDTHWNGFATAALMSSVIERIDPSLLAGVSRRVVRYDYDTDLGRALGVPTSDVGHEVEISRRGVTTTTDLDAFPGMPRGFTIDAVSTDEPLYPGKVVVIGDSMALGLTDKLASFADTTTYLHTFDLNRFPDVVESELRSAQVVVLVIVERYVAAGVTFVGADALVDVVRSLPPS